MKLGCFCREGDLVTVTDKNDISKALEELVTTADKLLGSSHSGRNTLQQMLPPLRLQLVPVESQEVCIGDTVWSSM